MKFAALLRKELRECLPWMLLVAIFFIVFGGVNLWEQTTHEAIAKRYPNFSYGQIPRYPTSYDSDINIYSFSKSFPIRDVGPFLLISSIALGLILGIRQFWMERLSRTWSFLIHRSINRTTVLWSKLAAASIVFVCSLGIIWSAFWWYSQRPGMFAVPSTPRILVEGWIFVVLGFMFYLGTVLADLSTARWYTTKLFGLAFAALILVTVIGQWSLPWAFIFIVIGFAILLSQIVDTFIRREF